MPGPGTGGTVDDARTHRQLDDLAENGSLKYRETIVEGIENAPKAFIGLFKGENFGKLIVKLA